jgi:hypothetical protein
MKIVFLDIDGVLNSEAWFSTRRAFDRANAAGFPSSHLDPAAIVRVNEISQATGAGVVLSTSWRSMEHIGLILYKHGMRVPILGKTPHLGSKTNGGVYRPVDRGHEIQAWMDEFVTPDAYVILDDDFDMLPLQREFFIRTDPKTGLTDGDVERAIKILRQ